MATAPAGATANKPSFAKIAASGLKPPSAPQNQNHTTNEKHGVVQVPRERMHIVTPSIEPSLNTLQAQPRTLEPAVKALQESPVMERNSPEVRVHRVDGIAKSSQDPPTAGGLLAPGSIDETTTQVSSSSDSGKPPSLDGKSVASGTTFALDEKESLRPDDSASVKAADDEDVFSAPRSLPLDSHIGSEEGVRAFRDQLREISSMEPPRHNMDSQAFATCPNPGSGVLYVPPQGPGIGVIPSAARSSAEPASVVDIQPDVKLLEALESPRDRIWVLKLEQDIYDFVKDPKEASLNLPQCHAYHRMLAHKIADYYMLGHVVDDSASAVRLYKTPDCRIPPPLTGITTPSTAASTPPPSAQPMKILRRGADGASTGSGLPSKTTSEDGEDDGKPKPPPSREEKEARYEAARLRIMGSAKPSDTPDETKVNDESRSSSAAGKKKSKKHRSDSDDGFEARSAYSAYYAQPYGSNGQPAVPYGYQGFAGQAQGFQQIQSQFPGKVSSNAEQHFSSQPQGGLPWGSQGFTTNSDGQHWNQPQQQAYDLSGHFDSAMTLPSPNLQAQPPHMAVGYNTGYQQQYYGQSQPWHQSEYHVPMQSPQPTFGQDLNYGNGAAFSSAQFRGSQPYPYGQLPSQTFPGRPPNNLEHPLPGSYKSKHFNPQSQSFVPGQPNGQAVRPFTSQTSSPVIGGYSGSFAMPNPLSRQASSHSQASPFGSPHHAAATTAQPMMHPLPQPVFPRQPSPNLPLPPKPGMQMSMNQQYPHPQPQGQIGNASSIAKWGAPASLPAKPPPPAESFDPNRHLQFQRQPSYNTAASARLPSGGIPTFGAISPMVGGMTVNGSAGGQPSRRM